MPPAIDNVEDHETTRARFEGQGSDTVPRPLVSALLGTAPKRTRTAAAMLFDIGGVPNKANVTNLLSGPGNSLTRMYNEISYGLQQVQVDVFGPYTLPVKNCLTIACCGPSSDRTGNGPTVQGYLDALPMKYDHYFWDYGAIPAGANCGTWGDEGTPSRPAVYSSYSFQGIVGQAQELGHNLGMTHEPTLNCTGAKTFLDDTSQCTHVEYGSSLSFMGSGARHPSAYHKYAQGWIGGCNVVKVGTSAVFNLVPQEIACNGAQLLQVAAPVTRPAPARGDRQGNGPMLSNYYLEMRASIGFDSGLKPMVLISIGAALPTTTMAAPYLYLLDMVPESGRADHTNAGLLTVGQSYSDPAGGLTITLTAINAQSATVSVTTSSTGGNTCVDGTPFIEPGPDGSSCAPLAATDGGAATGSGGAAGRTGTAGTSGTAGSAGTGGTTGTTGMAGRSGATGGVGGRATAAGGSTGTTGSGGGASSAGGRPGTGGAVAIGSGGVRGEGGAAPSNATGGSGTGGAGSGGIPGPGAAPSSGTVGGCTCSATGTSSGPPAPGGAEGLATSLVALTMFCRRRAKRGAR